MPALTDEQEDFIRSYCKCLQHTQFDKARILIEQHVKTLSSSSVNVKSTPSSTRRPTSQSTESIASPFDDWLVLLRALNLLAAVEKTYYTLAFVQRRRFLLHRSQQSQLRAQLYQVHAELAAIVPIVEEVAADEREGVSAVYSTTSSRRSSLAVAEECREDDLSGDDFVDAAHPSIVHHLAAKIQSYAMARADMVNFYADDLCGVVSTSSAQNLPTNPPPASSSHAQLQAMASVQSTYSHCITVLTEIEARYKHTFHDPLLSVLYNTFFLEVQSVRLLLMAHEAIAKLEVLPSLLNLQDARQCIQQLLHEQPDEDTKSFNFLRLFRSRHPTSPTGQTVLCTFIRRLYDMLVHKFTVYMYEYLVKLTTEQEMRMHVQSMMTTHGCHLMNNIHAFYKDKKNKLMCCAVVLDGSDESNFQGVGYTIPESSVGAELTIVEDSPEHAVAKQPSQVTLWSLFGRQDSYHSEQATGEPNFKGVDSYSILYTHPSEHPSMIKSLLPSVVMLINSSQVMFNDQPDGVADDYDPNTKQVVHLAWIEQAIYFVCVTAGRSMERQSPTNAFISDCVNALRTNTIVALVKQGGVV